MKSSSFRTFTRWTHILIGLFIGAYFYSPLAELSWSLPLIQFILVPLLAVSGIALWKQAQFMKLFNLK